MSEGFMVKSRWGMKQHSVNCTCGVCKSKRKGHAKELKQKVAEPNESLSSTSVLTPKHDTVWAEDAVLASADHSTDAPVHLQSGRFEVQPAEASNASVENKQDTSNGINTAPANLHADKPPANKTALKVI